LQLQNATKPAVSQKQLIDPLSLAGRSQFPLFQDDAGKNWYW